MGCKKQSRLVRSANQEKGSYVCVQKDAEKVFLKKLDLECGRRGARHKIGDEWVSSERSKGSGALLSSSEEEAMMRRRGVDYRLGLR
jgi:hypothetical protein